MRTTVRLEGQLLQMAKAQAAASGRSLNDFVNEAVRVAVYGLGTASSARPAIPVFRGGRRLLGGVSLDSNAALLDLMEDSSSHRYIEPKRRVSERVAPRRSKDK